MLNKYSDEEKKGLIDSKRGRCRRKLKRECSKGHRHVKQALVCVKTF